MKRAIVLFELIISIILLSTVMLFSVQFYQKIEQVNQNELKEQLHAIELHSTKLFLTHLFKKGVHFQATTNRIQFFEKDIQGFLNGSYSGVASLQKSSKVKIITPKSHIKRVNNLYAVYFNEDYWYEIIPSSEDEAIYFKYPNKVKTLFEHYSLIKRVSTLSLQKSRLFYNQQLLLENVTSFTSVLNNQLLTLKLCQEKQCVVWRFQV